MSRPRIVLIHAMHPSMAPARAAFAAWPEADVADLLDDSLARDLERDGRLTPQMTDRFLALAAYARGTGAEGILFTCSAFGPAIETCQRALPIPVLKPNEAALEEALDTGARIGLMATFAPGLPSLQRELEEMARARGHAISVDGRVADGALAALKAGRLDEHDTRIAETADAMADCDVLVLCQFSMARAAGLIAPRDGRAVLTTPGAAVAKLRRLVEARLAA
ncbi:MAG: arylsulfatase [Alphaproteobacteria bacterium]|nr:arylsulfatase [Alphaproteobacteria bacterium]